MASSISAPFKQQNGVEQSSNDDRSYRHILLKNGMRVLLCSDPTTDMAGAALEVSMGHFSDPRNIPGLAHFCEHMLFMGTEKYKGENEYSEYLNENGGYSNAYTASEATQYQLEVSKGGLNKALDMFAQFFISPLFTATATGRELEAVDSEHSKNLQNDMWRDYQLDGATSSPAHPYSMFGTGNSKTLRDDPAAAGVDVREALLAMHKAHYSAGRMTLAVLGAEGLDTLEEWVRELFSAVKDNGSVPPVFPGHPYDGVKGTLQYVVPVKDRRVISVTWALPAQKKDWKAKSAGYLSHLLGHEGPGSLLSSLRERGWATGLSSYEQGESGYSLFSTSVELSPAGLQAWESVLDLLYAYIGLLRAVGPQQWVFDEQAALASTAFRFTSKQGVFNTVSSVAHDLAEYPAEHVLTGSRLYWDWAPASVQELVALLTPSNSRVRISAKDDFVVAKATSTETWYSVKFGEEAIGEARMARQSAACACYEEITKSRMASAGGAAPTGGPAALRATQPEDAGPLAVKARLDAGKPLSTDTAAWEATNQSSALASLYPPLTLPAQNDFIATDFDLRSPAARALAAAKASSPAAAESDPPGSRMLHGVRVRREDAPSIIRADPRHELWLCTDEFFAVPKMQVRADVFLPAAYVSPRSMALLELAVMLAKENLTEMSYSAQLASLNYALACTWAGLNLTLAGFHHKLPVLAQRVAAAVPRLSDDGGFSDVSFSVQLDRLTRAYANFSKDQPYQHASQNTTVCMSTPRWSTPEKAAALAASEVTPDELRSFLRHAFSSTKLSVLVVGNANAAEAVAIADGLLAPVFNSSNRSAQALPPLGFTLTCPRMVALPQAILVKGDTGSVTALAPELIVTRPASNPLEANAAAVITCQIGPVSSGVNSEQGALVELLGHILSEPFFDSLRTQQQLGYLVFAGTTRDIGVEGFRFLVQSNRVHKAEELLDRTNIFLTEFSSSLASMPADRFASHVKATAIKCAEADKNMNDLASRLWTEVSEGSLDFHGASNTVQALFGLTQERVVAWFNAYVAPGGHKRRLFVSLIERGAMAEPIGETPPVPAAPAGVEAAAEGEGVASSAPVPEPETLAGGQGQGGAEVRSDPAPPAPPSIRLPLASAAGVLHVLHTYMHSAYTPGTPTDKDMVLTAIREMCSPDAADAVASALASDPPPKHVRLVVDVDEHHAVRTALPLFHNAGSITRAVRANAFAAPSQ